MPPKLHERAKGLQNHVFEGSDKDASVYGATEFGGFGQYFANKQIKLQNQAQEALSHRGGLQSTIFKDCVIHVNGYTKPSAPLLKSMITEHGGTICNYLAGKTYATHIIASNLTARKKEQFKSYIVVRPEWVVESVSAGRRLNWADYRVSDLLSNTNRRIGFGVDIPSAVSPDFIKSYYNNSRLHHLSTWKADLKRKFQARAQRHNNGRTLSSTSFVSQKSRFIMHIDFDSFFVAVSLLKYHDLVDKPVCVSNSRTERGNGDVASCNYAARKYGVRNGMWLSDARELCPELQSIPYDFEGYESASNDLYTILLELNPDTVFPVSVDEALVDITSLVERENGNESVDEKERISQLSSTIRQKVVESTGVTVSVGCGSNVLMAKIALRKAKPNGQYYIPVTDNEEELGIVNIRDLPGVGHQTYRKLEESLEITTVKELRQVEEKRLQILVGTKLGGKLYQYARGIDTGSGISTIPLPKSIGLEISWGVRLADMAQLRIFTRNLCGELAERMHTQSLMGRQLTIKLYVRSPNAPVDPPKYLGHGACDITSKSSTPLDAATWDVEALFRLAWQTIISMRPPARDVRGVGLQVTKLSEPSSSPMPPPISRFTKAGEPVAAGNLTLTQHMRNSASGAKRPLELPEEFDADIFNQLPDELQKEIRNNPANQLTKEPRIEDEPTGDAVIRLPRTIAFRGMEDMDTIKRQLAAWIRSTQFPHGDDVAAVENFILACGRDYANWVRALKLVDWMRQVVDREPSNCGEWKTLIEIWHSRIPDSPMNSPPQFTPPAQLTWGPAPKPP
ncbi:hypothetical protein TRVA0_005S02212 [Trichomonascus vanleenenianus]|uniref:deoxycytidyl transferase n=1 Tax=Trichomonascus vanleenenianus TaxID=2268995 RepID=UPI003ECA82E3